MSAVGKVAGRVYRITNRVIDRMLDELIDPEDVKAALAADPQFISGDRFMFHGPTITAVGVDSGEGFKVIALCRTMSELVNWGFNPFESSETQCLQAA
ncbi:hypothetical protein SEA_KUDEFRE_50 [Gordonia phage Kudefre]|uniref:Uncharacterized protein n=1 Tax=Gordonia phage Kudefre TaxID=2885975 RepID=A0AAE9C1Z1_9CAUD|nr:hypothetical protein L3Y24_gp050 [Gordonia phage Kudefre]UDL15280.1 hypothetical protein SEA_KUDEFRE_50 [Gordonia phage Kudefre]